MTKQTRSLTFGTGKAISRRTILRGAGAALALPMLDAMTPAFALGSSTPIHRFQTVYVPNGMAMDYWLPTTVGRDFELTPILQPLAAYKEKMLVLSGLKANWNIAHAGAGGSFLTGVTHGGRNEVEILADVSVDQLLARHLRHETQLSSLELSMDAPALAGACTANLSCVYTHTLSWRSPTEPLPTEHNPRAVFERLFGDSGSTARDAREIRLRQQSSILDAVMDKLLGLESSLGAEDRHLMESYTESVRNIERRIQKAEEQIDQDLPEIDQPAGVPALYEDHMEIMQDLQVLALQSDLTRVITFMMSKEQSARPYPQIEVPDAHHPLSHHNNNPQLVEKMSRINSYHTTLFARYLDKLAAIQEGDRTLLDNMTILYGAGISNSTIHSGDNLPVLLLGGGAGWLYGGEHVQYLHQPTMADLHLTLMDRFKFPIDRIGGSTEPLPIF
ncbi:MAG TPA: DUF1552 domain-containing protein [Gammaproteobacteria bacterium]|jgi:hypothetical protein|nr:DUF1552 domain-containing protein [Gammaproteobacteria bacterium]HIL64376.1 DUF1552 domain-containing protein [Porticoccaceae bacterium]